LQHLAAGPLDDLLAAHGSALIERIETEARRNPAFNLLLGGVWQNTMSPDVWGRIQAARLEVWSVMSQVLVTDLFGKSLILWKPLGTTMDSSSFFSPWLT
jgi:hypothetical protein